MEKMTVETAKSFLKASGYYVDNLWQISDVQDKFNCTDEEAQRILDAGVHNDYIVSEINESIDNNAEAMGFVKIEETE